MNELIKIITRFKSPQLTAREYINFSQGVLLHLKKFHPLFAVVHSWGRKPTSWTRINEDFSNFQAVVFEHIREDDISYINSDRTDKELHLDSMLWKPFLNSYSNTKKHEDGRYSVSIGAGKGDELGYINFELPRINYPEFYQFETIEKLITHLTGIIDLTGAYMYTQSISSKVADYSKECDIRIGWMNYFEDKGVLNYLPSDVQQKELSNGALFWLGDKITEPTEAMIQTAITIRNTLGEEGFLNL